MAANNRGVDYSDLWKIYKEQEFYQEQIRHWMALEKNLPILSWTVQLEVLDNAPMDIIKAHAHLLDPRAAQKLGVETPKKIKRKEWQYRALL